jgi:hypothetical protein
MMSLAGVTDSSFVFQPDPPWNPSAEFVDTTTPL